MVSEKVFVLFLCEYVIYIIKKRLKTQWRKKVEKNFDKSACP